MDAAVPQSPPPMPPQKETAGDMRRRTGLLLGLFAAVAALLALSAAFFYTILSAPMEVGSDRQVLVDVPRGASTADIAAILENKGLVKNRVVFLLLARWSGADGRLRAGRYRLTPAMTPREILAELERGGETLTRSFTIPEGFTVEDIIKLLARRGLAPEDDLRRAFNDPTLAADFLPAEGTPERAGLRYALEGYLFPDTYQVGPEASARDIAVRLVERFRLVFNEQLRARARELGLTVHQAVTLASIVEREARVPAERPLIAGVYWNRLRLGMRLDADPTVRYALGKFRGPLLYRDLEADSPFNTYRRTGLPPGPIASPGEAAIRAALYPADTPHLYFVARGDGSHIFARTLAEHNRNVARMGGR